MGGTRDGNLSRRPAVCEGWRLLSARVWARGFLEHSDSRQIKNAMNLDFVGALGPHHNRKSDSLDFVFGPANNANTKRKNPVL
jgi:hypothetical protein